MVVVPSRKAHVEAEIGNYFLDPPLSFNGALTFVIGLRHSKLLRKCYLDINGSEASSFRADENVVNIDLYVALQTCRESSVR